VQSALRTAPLHGLLLADLAASLEVEASTVRYHARRLQARRLPGGRWTLRPVIMEPDQVPGLLLEVDRARGRAVEAILELDHAVRRLLEGLTYETRKSIRHAPCGTDVVAAVGALAEPEAEGHKHQPVDAG